MEKQYNMDLSGIKLPRELETEGVAETILEVLTTRTVQLWSGSNLCISMITMNNPRKIILKGAFLNGRIGCGLETISDKLDAERKGIDHLRKNKGLSGGNRVSRLLLVSNDGAERFYRRIEKLLQLHEPRVLCCMLDIDGKTLGRVLTGKEKQIKIVLAEHKETVSAILRTLLATE